MTHRLDVLKIPALRRNALSLILAAVPAAVWAGPTPEPQGVGLFNAKVPDAWRFENGTSGWRFQGCQASISRDQAVEGTSSLRLDVAFPTEALAYFEGDLQLDQLDGVRFSALVPEAIAKAVRVMFYVKDKDGTYYQYLHAGRMKPAQWQDVRVDVSSGSPDMAPHGHFTPWNRVVASRMNLMGIKFLCDVPCTGAIYLDQVVPEKRREGPGKLQIVDFQEGRPRVGVFEKYEITFRLSREFSNPFDPDEVRIDAVFRNEVSGKTSRVPAFFYQDYVRSNDGARKERFRVEEANKDLLIVRQEKLTALGAPEWRVRFTPVEPGQYSYVLTVQAGGETCQSQPRQFAAVPSTHRGFIRVARTDRRYFEFDNGDFFYPIGHNVRSPFDERWWVVVLKENKLPPDRGTYAYDDLFRKMQENGENFAEVWMASWWLAIEWNKEWRGFQGLSRYNLENAWKLDYMLSLAEKHDIYLHLVLDNHGKGSTWCDPEWDDNPYSMANGGPVEDVEGYFTNRDAMRLYRKTLRYLVARWAYHPRILGFELWSELDLTGNSYEFVFDPVKVEWHREFSSYLKETDPWRHLVTTHFSTDYSRVDPNIARLPNIEYVVVDAYRHRGSIVPLILQTYLSCGQYGKPTFVTEYGGSPWATSADQVIPLLKADLHAGLWATFMTPSASTPLLWWFEFVEHQNQYFQFKALARFAKGEDRRGKNLENGTAIVRASSADLLRLSALSLRSSDLAYIWVYDRLAMEHWPTDGDARRYSGVSVQVPGLRAGDYQVEVWNTMTGEIMDQKPVKADRELNIALPEFTIDCALKIKRKP